MYVPGGGSDHDGVVGREVIGGGGADRRTAKREIEEAARTRDSRSRADGRMELNVLASLLGRAVRQTEGKDGDSGGGSGEVMEAFKLNLFAEDPFAAAAAAELAGRGQQRWLPNEWVKDVRQGSASEWGCIKGSLATRRNGKLGSRGQTFRW